MAKTAAVAQPTNAQLADELGQLEKEYDVLIAPFKLKLPRIEALRKQLREACPAAKDAEWRIEGMKFAVTLGPRAQWRSVDVAKLLKLIGIKVFIKMASVTLGALEGECKPEVVDAVVVKDYTGPRSIKIVEKGV